MGGHYDEDDVDPSTGRGWLTRRRFIAGAAASAGVAATDVAWRQNSASAAPKAIDVENAKSGSDGWDIYPDDSIEGFPTDYSVNAGDTIGFKIQTPSTDYRIDIYRIGWYGGTGGRKVATVLPSVPLPQTQPAPISDLPLGLVDCGNWAVSASWAVPGNAVSGVYLAIMVRQDVAGELSNRIQFVVRNDGRQSDIHVQTSDTTYHAYNRWGGYSLYWAVDGQATYGRAVKVSYNRPMHDGELENTFLYGEAPLVRWLERNGYDVTYTSDLDTERYGAELLNHKVFVSSGHDEYWSGGMRQNVEAARDAGVNLIFMSGNEVFWKTRWEPSIDGTATPYKTLVCYKETLAGDKIDPSPEWTGTWRDGRFSPPSNGGRPENGLTGTLFKAINSTDDPDFAIEVPSSYSQLRFWRNTDVANLAPGAVHTLTDATLGYEWNTDGDLPDRPAGLIRLSETTQSPTVVLQDEGATYQPGILTHYMTTYRAPSGALVWSTGTVQWSWGLDDNHPNRPNVPIPTDRNIQQATLNMLADMDVQPVTRQGDLVPATASTDTTAPVSTIVSPAAGTTVEAGSLVTLTGTASDSGGGMVAAVEVSVDGGASWKPVVGTDTWTYSFVPFTEGALVVKVRAIDDSCNIEPDDGGLSITVGPRGLPGSIWQANVTPSVTAADDPSALELGLRFRSHIDGFATGVRFYKGAGNDGPHTGRLWTTGGALLGSVDFANETATGWQTALFAVPISVSANTDYIVSYSAPSGHYSYDAGYFANAFELAPLRAPAQGEGGNNGVFGLSPGAFPNKTYGSSNYWVDVMFDTDDQLPPSVLSSSPAPGVSQVEPTDGAAATFSEPIVPSSIQMELSGPAGPVDGSVSYDAATSTATFQPTAALAPLTEYTATVLAAVDEFGDALAGPYAWSFTTAGSDSQVPIALWTSAAAPAVAAVDDPNAVELGVKFRVERDGFIEGVRFYKGTSNGGTHLGRLWSLAGDLLATATFSNESATGWQEVSFDAPVPVVGGQHYVASYYAPEGNYAVTGGFFTAAHTRGPLTAPDSDSINGNGVFRYGAGGGFPTSSYNRGNYWVDAVYSFPPDLTAPNAVSVSPPRDIQAVHTGTDLSVRFDKQIDPASLSFTLAVTGGAAVNGTASVDPADPTRAIFVPSSALAMGTSYTATATASGTNGTPGSPVSWSFETAMPAGSTPATVWDSSALPAVESAVDANAIEVGMRFMSHVDGVLTGVRFYKGPLNTGTHVGHLWTNSGVMLGEVTFDDESDEGWQQANLATPVPITAGTRYVVSYHAPHGGYAATSGMFSSAVTRPPLETLVNGDGGGNGIFSYGSSGTFPTTSFGATNYWVDVVVLDAGAPTVVAHTPADGAVGVPRLTPINATLSEAVVAGSATIQVTEGGAAVAGTATYDPATLTVEFTPKRALRRLRSFSVTVSGATDGSGNTMQPFTWSFETGRGM